MNGYRSYGAESSSLVENHKSENGLVESLLCLKLWEWSSLVNRLRNRIEGLRVFITEKRLERLFRVFEDESWNEANWADPSTG